MCFHPQGAPRGLGAIPRDLPNGIFQKQTQRMVTRMSFAAYMLRKDREESAKFALRQHFRNRKCGSGVSCASWWLKARELKAMAKRFSETGHGKIAPQHERFTLIKSSSGTALVNYWISRICTLEHNFTKLFARLRLPEEQQASMPCSQVSAVVILATIMGEITLLIRRRSLTKSKKRMDIMNRMLSFLEEYEVPTPCNSGVPSESHTQMPHTRAIEEECKRREAATRTFLHMKSLIDAQHVKVGLSY